MIELTEDANHQIQYSFVHTDLLDQEIEAYNDNAELLRYKEAMKKVNKLYRALKNEQHNKKNKKIELTPVSSEVQ